MYRENLEELGTMELVVIGIYGRFAKAFILIVVDGTRKKNTYFFINLCN
jgi:hypothetical protein